MFIKKWYDFNKKKPKEGQYCLTIDSEGKMNVYYWEVKWENCFQKYGGNLKVYNITHWMPLPKPPKM